MREMTYENVLDAFNNGKGSLKVVDINTEDESIIVSDIIALRDDTKRFQGEFIVSALIRVPNVEHQLAWYMCHPVLSGRGMVLVMEDVLEYVNV